MIKMLEFMKHSRDNFYMENTIFGDSAGFSSVFEIHFSTKFSIIHPVMMGYIGPYYLHRYICFKN